MWSGVGAWFGGIWDSVVSSVHVALVAIKQAFANWLAGMPAPVQEMVANIGSIFSGIATIASSAWSGITAVAKSVFDAVVAVWQGLSSAVSSAWQDIVGVASSVWDSVKSTVTSAINAIKPIITSVASVFSAAWQGLVAVASSVWSAINAAAMLGIAAIKASLTAGVTGFAVIFNAGFNAVKTVVSTVFNAIKALVRGDIDGVKTAIQSGLSQLAGIARNAITQMVSVFKNAGNQLRSVGGDIIQGLINGLKAKAAAAASAAREVASSAVNAFKSVFRTASPSKATREIGEWVSEGLAIGIAYKAPMAADEAKKMAENAKKAIESEMESTARSIFLMQQKIRNNPFAELTADIAFGKYQGQDTSQLLALKEEERRLGSILNMTDDLRKLKQDIALVGKSNLEIMEWEYQHTDKYLGISREQFDAHKKANAELERRNKLLADTNDLAKKQQDLQKRVALFGNTDPLAEVKYDLQFSTADQAQKDTYLADLSRQNAKEAFGSLQNSYHIETPAQKLEREYQEKLAVITNYEQQIVNTIGAAVELRKQVEASYAQSVLEMEAKTYEQRISGYQAGLNLISGVWDKMTEVVKKSYGEQSTAAKIMFAGQKIIAIAQALINTELAATKSLAEGGAIAGIPMAKIVRATGYASVGLIASQTIDGLTGQAHDGIMSVPKSGTWNLEKGERVLPRHTAKALDDKLDSMGSGRAVNNINVNVSVDSNGSDVTSAHNFGKRLGDAIRTAVQQELMREKRQGGALYGI